MNERFMELFYELYHDMPRQGPGNKESTRTAYSKLTNLHDSPLILDVGCGVGKQTIDLANISNATILAVDNYLPFLRTLNKTAKAHNVENRIITVNADMFELCFAPNSFDVIWAEGSIYNLGFEKGLRDCSALIKPGGYIAVTEVCWLKTGAPEALSGFWEQEYPAITDIQGNLDIIRKCSLDLVDYFILPESAWWENYYLPLQKQIVRFQKKVQNNKTAADIVNMTQREIDIYKQFSDYYGYVFYVMQKS